jgi:4-hydroxy-3-polyprenylbenzoate decarboxylase
MKILVCITGASGTAYGVQLIRQLKALGHEVHLVVTKWGEATLKHETGLSATTLGKEVHKTYREDDLAAGPASGSFPLDSVAIVPCSMSALKERRKLVIVPRETPLNLIHIRNMAAVTEAGAVVMPASPAFWHRPDNVEDLVSSFVERLMVQLGALKKPSIEWTGE